MSHTAGEWYFEHLNVVSWGIKSCADKRSIAAISSNIKRPPEENEANARLIIAAPVMLAALRRLASITGTVRIQAGIAYLPGGESIDIVQILMNHGIPHPAV